MVYLLQQFFSHLCIWDWTVILWWCIKSSTCVYLTFDHCRQLFLTNTFWTCISSEEECVNIKSLWLYLTSSLLNCGVLLNVYVDQYREYLLRSLYSSFLCSSYFFSSVCPSCQNGQVILYWRDDTKTNYLY